MLGASLAMPDYDVVIPFCPEPIMKQVGVEKNDHERVAFKRFYSGFQTRASEVGCCSGT